MQVLTLSTLSNNTSLLPYLLRYKLIEQRTMDRVLNDMTAYNTSQSSHHLQRGHTSPQPNLLSTSATASMASGMLQARPLGMQSSACAAATSGLLAMARLGGAMGLAVDSELSLQAWKGHPIKLAGIDRL